MVASSSFRRTTRGALLPMTLAATARCHGPEDFENGGRHLRRAVSCDCGDTRHPRLIDVRPWAIMGAWQTVSEANPDAFAQRGERASPSYAPADLSPGVIIRRRRQMFDAH